METTKLVKPYQNDAIYQKAARELMQHNVLPEDTPEMLLAAERQKIRSDLVYKKNYEETKAKNIPGPIENYHDYKAQAAVKAVTNDHTYKADYREMVKKNMMTEEYCNTEQYKINTKITEIQSGSKYSDFPETRAKYQGFQHMEVDKVPLHNMHARNADQLSEGNILYSLFFDFFFRFLKNTLPLHSFWKECSLFPFFVQKAELSNFLFFLDTLLDSLF